MVAVSLKKRRWVSPFRNLRVKFFFKQKTAYEINRVTGVQTCALPISARASRGHERLGGVQPLRLLGLDEVVDDGVEEGAADGHGAAEHLEGRHALAEGDGAADDDDGALGRVGHRVRNTRDLLEREGGDLVVHVEGQAGHDRVVDEARGARQAIGRPHFPELVHLGVLARHEDQREDEDRRPQRCDGVHVAAAADGRLEGRSEEHTSELQSPD